MSEDIKFKLITYVDTDFEAKTQECEYFIELEDGVERSLKDILKENIEQQVTISKLEKDNEKLEELVDVSMKADEVFSVFDDLKYIESALTFLIDNSFETQCVECEREDIHFVAERLRIVLRSLDSE